MTLDQFETEKRVHGYCLDALNTLENVNPVAKILASSVLEVLVPMLIPLNEYWLGPEHIVEAHTFKYEAETFAYNSLTIFCNTERMRHVLIVFIEDAIKVHFLLHGEPFRKELSYTIDTEMSDLKIFLKRCIAQYGR